MTDKEGFTVKELQQKGKKYAVEIALVVIFALTAIFALVWGGAMIVWSIILSMALAIVGALLPKVMDRFFKASMSFLFGKQPVVGIVIAVVFIILAVFVPALPFAVFGLVAGKSLVEDCYKSSNQSGGPSASKSSSESKED
jgi:hypothetical protein